MMNRDDFPILDTGVIYFDNGATSLKPKQVVEAMNEYYYQYGANIHRGDYQISLKASDEYEQTRDVVARFIHAKSAKEIVFTAGATDGLNKIVFGFMEDYLNDGDEVLLTKAEHASNVIPWLELAKEKIFKYILYHLMKIMNYLLIQFLLVFMIIQKLFPLLRLQMSSVIFARFMRLVSCVKKIIYYL